MPSIAVSPLAHSQLINQSHFFGSLAPATSQKGHRLQQVSKLTLAFKLNRLATSWCRAYWKPLGARARARVTVLGRTAERQLVKYPFLVQDGGRTREAEENSPL